MIEMLYVSKQKRYEARQVSWSSKTNIWPSTSYLTQNKEERQTIMVDIH